MSKDTKKRKQTERLQIRCSADDREVIERGADLDNRTLTNFVVTAALDRARELKKKRG